MLTYLLMRAIILALKVRRWCRGVVVKHTDSNAGVVSSNPARVTMKTPLVRKETVNHFMKSTSLEKTQNSVSGFCHT